MDVPVSDARRSVLCFAEFELDLEQQELRKNGQPISLAPQPFKVLELLVVNSGRLVTREELQEQVWGSVNIEEPEVSLNHCIKQIRNALKDDAEKPHLIKTVRSKGYRLMVQVDPVQPSASHIPISSVESSPSAAASTLTETMVSPDRRGSRLLTTIAGLAAVLLVSVIAVPTLRTSLVQWLRTAPGASSSPTFAAIRVRRGVAVLGFRNLAGKQETAWLSTALSEMLTTELAAGGQLRTISGENVARAKRDLSLSNDESYAPDTLARIHTNLNADFVVLGSYVDLGGQVRLDLRLQDTGAGSILAAISETGSEAKLFDLVARTGAELRGKLGLGEMTAEETNTTRASVPSNPEAARLYAEGIDRLRSFDALGARDLLQQSLRIEPDFPLTHAALSDAWRILGDSDATREESRKAFEASGNLSREDRLYIEGRYREASSQWNQAIQAYRALFTLAPDDLDYGLALARTQWTSGKPEAALTTLARLKALPAPVGDDPQIDLEESIAATEARNSERAVAAAARAAQKAKDRGAKLLLARALRAEAEGLLNLGEMDEAQKTLDDVQQAARAVGDDDSAAYELFALGKLRLQQEDLSGAESSLEDAERIWRKNGDRTYAALSSMLLGIISGAEGSPAKAQQACEHALSVSQDLGDKETYARILFFLGDVLAAEGNLPRARQKDSEAATIMAELGSKVNEDRSDLVLAQLSIAEGHPLDAEAGARRVLDDPQLVDAPDLKLAATMVLAQALLAQGKTAEAQQALAADSASRNTPMVAAGINFGFSEGLSILGERLRASTGRPNDVAEATGKLHAILAESAKRGNLVRQFQARLALGEIETKWGDKSAGRTQLALLEQNARARGFGLIAQQAGALRHRS